MVETAGIKYNVESKKIQKRLIKRQNRLHMPGMWYRQLFFSKTREGMRMVQRDIAKHKGIDRGPNGKGIVAFLSSKHTE